MRRLAIDTSSVACTVALQFDDGLYERHEEQAREHTRLLLPMIRQTLHEAGAKLQDLDAIVLGNGPGSFIGMRIAASVAQGLAHGAGLEIVPVSSLAAVAAEVLASSDAETVVVAQDAHMNEVYLGIYEASENDLLSSITDERLYGGGQIDDLHSRHAASTVAAGSGWDRYPEYLSDNADVIRGVSAVIYPRARFLLELSAAEDAISPTAVEPAYIRQEVAKKSA